MNYALLSYNPQLNRVGSVTWEREYSQLRQQPTVIIFKSKMPEENTKVSSAM